MLAIYDEEDLRVVLKSFGNLLKLSSAVFLIGAIASVFLDKNFLDYFYYYILSGAIALFIGLIFETLKAERELQYKHAFLIVALVWLFFPLLAALPFVFCLGMNILDAYFESVSALTTTGLSVMTIPESSSGIALLDLAPKSLIFWRSFISWIGGVGIVLIAYIGVFGRYTRVSRILLAEGHEERLRASLINSAKEIFLIYSALTIIGIVLLYLAGMDFFDAINYSMSAISTTGVTTDSKGLYVKNNFWQNEGRHNYWSDIVLVIIMVLGATSFYVHYMLRKGDKKAYLKDVEFLGLIVIGSLAFLILIPSLGVESSFFHSFSAITCGGFSLVSEKLVGSFPAIAKIVLLVLMIIGGSSNSTAGGIKIARFLIFLKGIYWKIREILLPKGAIFAKKFEGRALSDNELKEVYFFILSYVALLFAGTIVLVSCGYSIENSFFEVASAQGNAGISTGITNIEMCPIAKIMLIISMLFGRLEIFPMFSLIAFPIALTNRKS